MTAKKAQKDTALLETLVAKFADAASSKGLSNTQLESILERVGTNTAAAMRVSLKPENSDHPHISAFSYPEGDVARPKPELRVKTFFCGLEEHAERLTPAEIEAYNAITTNREARGGDWKAQIRKAGQPGEELYVSLPCESVDQRMGLPPLELIMLELNGGPSTADLAGLMSKIRVQEKELASLRAAQGTADVLQAEIQQEGFA